MTGCTLVTEKKLFEIILELHDFASDLVYSVLPSLLPNLKVKQFFSFSLGIFIDNFIYFIKNFYSVKLYKILKYVNLVR